MPAITTLANTENPLGPGGVFLSDVIRIDDPSSGSYGASIMDALALLSGGGTLEVLTSSNGTVFQVQGAAIVLAAGVPSFVQGLRLTGSYARLRLTDSGASSPSARLHANLRSW